MLRRPTAPWSPPSASPTESVEWSPRSAAAEPAADPSEVPPANVKVLVIDDDPALVRLVSATLRDGGFTVTAAGNGVEGLQCVEDDPPDAIVLDLNMPVMDGQTFFRELRGRGKDTPVLVLSAHGARDARRAIGADAAMEKPFDPDALVVRVRLLIERRTSALDE